MSGYKDNILLTASPFSREYRRVLVNLLRDSESTVGPVEPDQINAPIQFLAKLTNAAPILTNRVWKYSWEQVPAGYTSTGGSDGFQFFALNGAEINNPEEQVTSGVVTEARASFGVRVGDLADPPSRVTLLPLTQGPLPLVVVTQLPYMVSVNIGDTDYDCMYWFHAANQVDVACGAE